MHHFCLQDRANVFAYDPVFANTDIELLESLNISPLKEDKASAIPSLFHSPESRDRSNNIPFDGHCR